MEHPFFTIGITTYNRQDLVIGAIESVLEQNFTDYELYIIDDASTDNTGQVVQQIIDQAKQRGIGPQITYWRAQKNSGLSISRSQVEHLANGQFAIYLDDDDRLAPGFLYHAHAVLSTAPDTVGFALSARQVYRIADNTQANEKKLLRSTTYGCQEPTIFPGKQYFQNSVGGGSGLIVRTAIVKTIGEWRTDVGAAEDTEYIMRMATKWDYVVIPDSVLIIYNLTDGAQITKNRYVIGVGNERLAEVYAKELAQFPFIHQNYYMVATSMYYASKAYKDGLRTFIKAVKIRPRTRKIWKLFAMLHVRIFRPNAFAHHFKHTRQDA